jgi:G6PDH family F420-dependent oxidoreductase
VTLGAIGQRTERLLLGTNVTCPIYRNHPVAVAHAFATLSALYPGRVFLGAGTGEALNEEPYAGWGPYRERGARLEEAIGLIKQLFAGGFVDYEGKYFQTRAVRLYDLPQRPLPVYMAASGPKSAALAGRAADGWITDRGTALRRPEAREAFESAARGAGRDPGGLARIVELWAVAGDREEALRCAPRWLFLPVFSDVVDVTDPRNVQRVAEERSSPERVLKTWLVSPDPRAHVGAIEELAAQGVTHVFVHSPQDDQQRVIDFYARDVLPALRSKS